MDPRSSNAYPQPHTCQLTAQEAAGGVVSMACRVFCQLWEGPGFMTLDISANATPLTPGNQLKQSEDLGVSLESLELLHSIGGVPEGLREPST